MIMALPLCACAKDEEPMINENDTYLSENKLTITVGGNTLNATLVDNDATKSLVELLKKGAITISMSDYGGFEKVGSLPQSLPRNDSQITTTAGDIMLYQGNQMVIFYGSNTWAYTRLGQIDGLSASELKEALGTGSVSVTLSVPSASSIETVNNANPEKTVAYKLDGTIADENTKGVVIEGGKKILRK